MSQKLGGKQKAEWIKKRIVHRFQGAVKRSIKTPNVKAGDVFCPYRVRR